MYSANKLPKWMFTIKIDVIANLRAMVTQDTLQSKATNNLDAAENVIM